MWRPGLDPTLVREQFYLLAHDETRQMRPHLHLPALSAGLAGATVMDLLIAQRVTVESGSLRPDWYQRSSTGDPITDDVLALIMQAAPGPPLPVLIRAASGGLYERTTAALVHKGVIVEGPPRRWRKGREYAIAHEGIAVRARARVGYRMEGRDGPSPEADSLCTLVSALNLHAVLVRGTRSEVEPLLQRVIRDLPENAAGHPIGEAAAVAAAVLKVIQDMATSAMM
ncbi:GPP34 family phosphoprotein [Actinoplanes oblitus]|uniref:GPP34 family phosphoprotein n=1 Tax=Actinoplanes oblitus TaxID=3040509 RepID=A0ABY8WNL5_9ACTN|nr:GPP34 family phosphoprotein [Actinoplanes oblitus]WIM99430.1 GPP34 family phosphoprotein [Actinoplanes oblitus]